MTSSAEQTPATRTTREVVMMKRVAKQRGMLIYMVMETMPIQYRHNRRKPLLGSLRRRNRRKTCLKTTPRVAAALN